jgi:uncharacterized protein
MSAIPDFDVDEARLTAICQRHRIARLEFFGAAASGTPGPDGEIAIHYTVRSGRRLGGQEADLAAELSGLFGRRVDLLSWRALSPSIQDLVRAESRPLYTA